MRVIYLFTLVLMVSCGGDDFKKIEKLGEFRVLAVLVNNPEVPPGATVNVQLFVSDIKAAGRTIVGTTIACIDPGIAFGAKVNCDHDPAAVAGTYTVNTTGMSGTLYTGLAADVLSATVPGTIFTGRSTREQFNGIGYIVIFKFTVDGESISVFKRIIATNRGSFNTNPTGSSILLNGGAIASFPDKNDELQATSSAPETFDYQTIEGNIESRTEKMQVAWYLTEGELDKPKSDVDEASKYLGNASTDPSLVIAIIRDERGGVHTVTEFFP